MLKTTLMKAEYFFNSFIKQFRNTTLNRASFSLTTSFLYCHHGIMEIYHQVIGDRQMDTDIHTDNFKAQDKYLICICLFFQESYLKCLIIYTKLMLMQVGNICKLFGNNKANHKFSLTRWFYSPPRTLASFMTHAPPSPFT